MCVAGVCLSLIEAGSVTVKSMPCLSVSVCMYMLKYSSESALILVISLLCVCV